MADVGILESTSAVYVWIIMLSSKEYYDINTASKKEVEFISRAMILFLLSSKKTMSQCVDNCGFISLVDIDRTDCVCIYY